MSDGAKIWIVLLEGGAEVPYMETDPYTEREYERREIAFAFTDRDRAEAFAEERSHVEGGHNYRRGNSFYGEDRKTGARKQASVNEYSLNPEKDGEGVWKW